MNEISILSTRFLESSVKEIARQSGVNLLEASFIHIHPLPTEKIRKELGAWRNIPLVFTSANGVSAALPVLKSHEEVLNVFLLSGKTRETLEQSALSFEIKAMADESASLAQLIIASGEKEVLFFCGDQRREELPRALRAAGVHVKEVIVYENKANPLTWKTPVDGILFFSPTAVESFCINNKLPEGLPCFAIGSTTAASIAAKGVKTIIQAARPTQEAMIEALIHYFETKTTTDK